MPRPVLIASNSIPGYGGGSTAAYALFRRVQADRPNVHFLNLMSKSRAEVLRPVFGQRWGNPEGLANVVTIAGSLSKPQPELTQWLRELSPRCILAAGHSAARVIKRAAPELHVTLLATGCAGVKRYLEAGKARDAVDLRHILNSSLSPPELWNEKEREAVECVDEIVVHSPLTRRFYEAFFPEQQAKLHREIIWWADWIGGEAQEYAHYRRPFQDREIDLLFVASRWNRIEKNLSLLQSVVRALPHLRTHVVGEMEAPIPGTHCHGLLTDREALFELMGNCKTVGCPSRWDAAPGVLFEGSVMGCNLVASKNCGNWGICHPELLADPFTTRRYISALERSVAQKFEDNAKAIVDSNSYQKLLRLLEES